MEPGSRILDTKWKGSKEPSEELLSRPLRGRARTHRETLCGQGPGMQAKPARGCSAQDLEGQWRTKQEVKQISAKKAVSMGRLF